MGQQVDAEIWNYVRKIPTGKVATYGQIAELSGIPDDARIVGQALQDAPKSLELPWHRVLRADGCIAFPKHSAAFKEQIKRLQEEGVTVINGGVPLENHQWYPEGQEPPQFQLF